MKRAIFAVALAACTHASNQEVVAISPAPPAAVSTSVPAMATALAAPSNAPAEKLLVGGEIVDLDSMTPHKLTGDAVLGGAIGDDTAYLWVRAPAGNELRAHDTTTGRLRWSAPIAECASITASSAGAFCSTTLGLRWFRRSDGVSTPIAAPLGVAAIVSLGGHVVVLHTNDSIQAFDGAGVPLGHATAPVTADHAFAHETLAVTATETMACGAHGGKTTTVVFCFDATPRVVWTRSVPVPGGSIRQTDDDVMVVTSDSWKGRSGESEIVRTADGTTLLHVNALVGAALTSNGTFDGALASDPDIVLYDAKGTKLWMAPQIAHREAIRAVRTGTTIAVAVYSPIATGTQLVGLDAASGAIAWRGNVDSLPIGHSEYWNAVDLRLRGKTLLLVGHEASQEYAQTFDLSGRRIGSVVRGR